MGRCRRRQRNDPRDRRMQTANYRQPRIPRLVYRSCGRRHARCQTNGWCATRNPHFQLERQSHHPPARGTVQVLEDTVGCVEIRYRDYVWRRKWSAQGPPPATGPFVHEDRALPPVAASGIELGTFLFRFDIALGIALTIGRGVA